MSYQPDMVIPNGDHIYWDIRTSMNKPFAKFIETEYWPKSGGPLDISLPKMDPRNAVTYLTVNDCRRGVDYTGDRARTMPERVES
ncbi:hypothetical protein [Microbulbifer taiwanensis]|uniref:Uncharacterized protein n=1 Tax=Microbulbifer taiwanensis TaxID=986746 RepID=A0ABW1YKW1_9GAMM|nr:hypothetical protein [Microbulbifer taiwanensis]